MGKTAVSWWLESDLDIAKNVFSTVQGIHNNSGDRFDRNVRCLRLYGNADLIGLGPQSMSPMSLSLPESRIRLNIVASMVDTVHSRLGKQKARVTFLTEGGDYTSQRQAKDLSQLMDGLFYMNDVFQKHKTAFRDAAICDVGAIKHYVSGNKICSERVLATELYADAADCIYGAPRSIYQVKYVARQVLKAAFPDKASSIDSSKMQIDQSISIDRDLEDFVAVVEAWHLPSVAGGEDGKHVISIGNDYLVNETYKKDYFPFTFFKWSPPVVGFWGQSLADRLTSIQQEINKMLRIIQRSFHLGSNFKIFLEYGSKVAKEHLNNDIGSIVYYMGQKPTYDAPKVVHEEYFKHLQFLVQSAYEEAGVSQLSAAARKPAGLDSGKALREYHETETERFASVSQDYESTFLETARIYCDLADDIVKAGGDFAVKAQSKNFIKNINWKDIAPAKNGFVLQMFPVSMLPHEPAGRLAFVQEMINGGMIPADEGLALLNFPDTASYLSLKNAALEDLMATLEHLIEEGYVPPEPYMDLQRGIPLMQSAYLRARREGVPDKSLDNIRRWIDTADAQLERAKAASGQQPGQQPGQVQPMLPVPPQGQAAPGSADLQPQ